MSSFSVAILIVTFSSLGAEDGSVAAPGQLPPLPDAAPPPSNSPFSPGRAPALPNAGLPPTLPGTTTPLDDEVVALPDVRTLANPSNAERQILTDGPSPTFIYPVAPTGPAWVGPAPDHPPLLPRLAPDLAKRLKYCCHLVLGMPTTTAHAAQPPRTPVANPPVGAEVAPSFTWRDWLTKRDESGKTRR